MIGYVPIMDNMAVLHHTLLFGNNEDFASAKNKRSGTYECGSGKGGVRFSPGLPAIWGVGYQGFCAPDSYGIRFGGAPGGAGFQSGTLQVHWNNPLEIEGLQDESGFKLYFTETLRPNDGATMMVGQMNLDIAPFSKKDHYADCNGFCFTEDITVTEMLHHMHDIGDKMHSYVYAKNRTLRVRPSSQDGWNYQLPGNYHFKDGDLKVHQGETLRVDCAFNANDGRVTESNYGEGKLDEMCILFVWYYPALPSLYGGCLKNEHNAICGGSTLPAPTPSAPNLQCEAGVEPFCCAFKGLTQCADFTQYGPGAQQYCNGSPSSCGECNGVWISNEIKNPAPKNCCADQGATTCKKYTTVEGGAAAQSFCNMDQQTCEKAFIAQGDPNTGCSGTWLTGVTATEPPAKKCGANTYCDYFAGTNLGGDCQQCPPYADCENIFPPSKRAKRECRAKCNPTCTEDDNYSAANGLTCAKTNEDAENCIADIYQQGTAIDKCCRCKDLASKLPAGCDLPALVTHVATHFGPQSTIENVVTNWKSKGCDQEFIRTQGPLVFGGSCLKDFPGQELEVSLSGALSILTQKKNSNSYKGFYMVKKCHVATGTVTNAPVAPVTGAPLAAGQTAAPVTSAPVKANDDFIKVPSGVAELLFSGIALFGLLF